MESSPPSQVCIIIIIIPDILRRIGSFLTPPDLLTAIRVSREWNSVLVPHLWSDIDDRLYAWPRILGLDNLCYRRPGTEDWVREIFKKYYRHIRHLHIRSAILVSAAASCFNHNDIDLTYRGRSIKSLTLGDMGLSTARVAERDAERATTIDHIADLIRANTKSLLVLTIANSNLPSTDTNLQHPIFAALHGLPNLMELNCGDAFCFRLAVVPKLWPRLAHLRTHQSPFRYNLTMDESIPSLRSLVLQHSLHLNKLIELLNHLPNLEILETPISDYSPDASTAGDLKGLIITPHTLKSLSVNWSRIKKNTTYYALFSFLPYLTELRFDDLSLEASKAVAACLPRLEVLVDNKKPKIAYSHDEINAPFALEPILQSCHNLRVLDGMGHRMMVCSLVPNPWATDKLDTLRCRVQGLNRLDPIEEVRYSRAMFSQTLGRKPNSKRAQIMQRNQACLEDHALLYSQLSRQTKLRVLELGVDLRVERTSQRRFSSGFQEYSPPLSDTPELSLASGLGQLSSLKELEVFGFEGFDHRIGTLELEWMALNWPRLKLLRGLEEDRLRRIRFDEHKAFLRRHLAKLRPQIQHASLGAYDPYVFWQ
ncbi:hypothetical protein BGZ95_005626 [Linnemannia exigua]|uniref:F-box domain-containing protein n=1 Tax=Linnemannia exigua TaxID=604196 RepID=A0AAD4DLI6_9FUNG|nr:hypothetical protein BGZ95_005626 [Linnemannia exigua]